MFEETIKQSIELWRDRGNLQLGIAAEFQEHGDNHGMLTACNWARQCFDHMDLLRQFLPFTFVEVYPVGLGRNIAAHSEVK